MIIPAANEQPTTGADEPWAAVEPDSGWVQLGPEAKHERILCAAGRLFSADGLDAPMPAVAALAGASVGSLYRQFPSKRDLLAALVTRRLEHIHEAAQAATARECGSWQALTEMLWTIVEQQHIDDFLGGAWAQVADHDDVARATALANEAIGRLLDAARAEGTLRDDAQTLDIRLVCTATRAAKQVGPDCWKRMLTLLIDGLAAKRPAPPARPNPGRSAKGL